MIKQEQREKPRGVIVNDSFCPSAFYNYPPGSIIVTKMPYHTEQGLSLQVGLVVPEIPPSIRKDDQIIREELLRARGNDFDSKNPEIRCYSQYNYNLFYPYRDSSHGDIIENLTVLEEMPPYKLFFSYKTPTTNVPEAVSIAERLNNSFHKSSTFREFVRGWPAEVKKPRACVPTYEGSHGEELKPRDIIDREDLRVLREVEWGYL